MRAKPKEILGLMPFIPALSPKYQQPHHLAPIVDLFTRIRDGEEIEEVVACPPRHGKTDTVSHGVVWLMKQDPTLRVCYVSHGARIAEKKSRRMLALAKRARVPLDPTAQAAGDWRTGREDGGLFATSPGGAIVGEGFDLIVLDDVVRDRVAAESALARDRLSEWLGDTLYTRKEPGGSILDIMHRWHPDDLSGRLIAKGWGETRLAAIDEYGRALWPERFSVERLAEIREQIGEYGWTSLYQGVPVARGGMLFRDLHHYDALPEGMRIVIGVDLAYSARTSRDYSVAVVLGFLGDRVYVIHVERAQLQASAFRARLAELRDRFIGAPLVSYIGGQESGILDLFAEQGLRIEGKPAVTDKFIRAQPTSAVWNAGKIFVPMAAPWLDAFVAEVCGFTGKGDRNDDQVDAMVAAFDRGRASTVASFRAPPPMYMGPSAAGFESLDANPYRNASQAADAIVTNALRKDAMANASPTDHATHFLPTTYSDPLDGF